MNGTAHLLIGTGIGFAAALQTSSPPAETVLFIAVGAISGMMPDIDINGKLSNRITLSHELFKHVAQLIGCLLIIYSFLTGEGTERWLGIGIGVAILLISTMITQRRMLTLTGAGLLLGGIALHELWILLLGIYIIAASFIPHRSYTHSILGVAFFGWIASLFEQAVGVNGLFVAAMAAYLGHLLADMKLLPFNKKGIKPLLPFSSWEI